MADEPPTCSAAFHCTLKPRLPISRAQWPCMFQYALQCSEPATPLLVVHVMYRSKPSLSACYASRTLRMRKMSRVTGAEMQMCKLVFWVCHVSRFTLGSFVGCPNQVHTVSRCVKAASCAHMLLACAITGVCDVAEAPAATTRTPQWHMCCLANLATC